jgi:hypothetical protein
MIRDDADAYWLACQVQHERITGPGPAILGDPRSIAIQGRIDVDLFIVTLRARAEPGHPRRTRPR